MTCPVCRNVDRRTFMGLLGAGLVATLAGCGTDTRRAAPQPRAQARTSAPRARSAAVAPDVAGGPIPAPVPGPPQVFSAGPAAAKARQQVALTIDDGYCADCAQGYVAFAAQSGMPITFSPNGRYHAIWAPLAETLKPLIDRGQVQIGNHTYNHPDLDKLSDTRVSAELEQNEAWIESTFGITARPWWRPPYGFHDARTDRLAADLGFTNVLMWNGSYGDSVLLTPQVLMAQAQKYLEPGTIMLGHANHPTVLGLFGQISALIAERHLHPVTLDEMFGTSRNAGRA